MLRTSWSGLATSAFCSLVQRVSQRSEFRRPARSRRRRAYDCFGSISVAAEVLEIRQLLSAPMAMGDSYSSTHDHTLTVASYSSVLGNDMNMGPGTMTAVQYSSPSHGTLSAFNSNGTFTYVPSYHFVGTDSFQYEAHNNDGYSSPATVTIDVTNAAPSIGAGHSFTIYEDSQSVSAANGVLNGDSDSDGDSITASLVSGPSHGSVTLNSDGSFTLTPTAGYYGADSFVAGVSDGIATTDETVSLTITSPFSAQTNSPDTPVNDYSSYGPFSASQLTGGVQVSNPLVQGHSLVYSSIAADVKPIVSVEFGSQVSTMAGIPAPDSFKVNLTYGGLSASTLYFNNTGLSGSMGTPTVLLADQIDASSLATGHYAYTMTVVSYYGSDTSTRVYTGYQDIVNLQASEFGKGWTLAEKDGLAVQSGGALWYSGSGQTAWFASNGSGGYTSPAGPLNSSTLVLNGGGTYTLTDKLGNAENFSSAGLRNSTVDTNGNTTSYAYSSGKLSTITDPYGRVTTFNYTSGLISSITDIASQTTTLAHSSTNVTSITAPIPAGGVAGPVTSYAYTGNLLTSITDPDSNVTVLTYSYGDRISAATFADSTTNDFTPAEMAGLVNTSTGTGLSTSNRATPDVLSSMMDMTSMMDGMMNTTTIIVDHWGNVVSYEDPLSLTTTYVYNSNDQITQMTQPNPSSGSPVTSYSYDSSGNLTQITHPDSTTDTWTYGTSGGSLNRPLTHTDQRGKTTTYTYSSAGNMLTSTNALSNVTTMTYNSDGTVATVTVPNPSTGGASGGLVSSYTYDADARVTRITNPDSTHKDFTYDTENNLLTSTDELGRVTSLAYDGDGRLVAKTLPNPSTGGASGGLVTYYAYDAAGNLVSETDPMANVTTYAYNSRGWLTSVTLPVPATGISAPVTSYGYDANGWRTTVTDAMGNVTTSAYDADGRLTSVTQPVPVSGGSAPVTNYSYDNLGRVTSVEDPNSHTTSYGYNSANEVTSVTDALSKVTSYTFDATGHVLTITAPVPATGISASVTTYTYSDVGKLLTTTDSLGNVTTDAYDHDGRLITVTAPVPATGVSAPVMSYTYDSLSRLSTETDPLGNVTTMGYDNAGELTSVTAPVPATGVAAPVTNYSYDGDGRQVTVTDPDSNVTTTAYNADGQVTGVTDAQSNTTSYAYDHDGRETSVTDANSKTESYSYNANGQVTSKTDKNGQVTNFTFDNDGRLTQEQWMSGGTAIYTASYGYDAAGNLTSASDNNSAYAYSYNSANHVTQIDNSGTPTGPHVVLNIGYDNMQRQTSLSATVAGTADFLNNYAYNADSDITQITQQGQTGGNTVAAKLVNSAFDNDGRMTSISRYANLSATQLVDTSTYGYDANSTLTSLSEDKGSTNLASYTWTYDHDGRLTADTIGSASDSYSYDAAGQLTAATHSGGGNESYSYGSTGNRTNTGYSTGTNNQLSSDGTYNYTYDNAGNLTEKTTISTGAYVTYTWDYRNRLTDVQAYNSSNVLQSHVHYVYDVIDRLIERQVDPTGGGTYSTTQAFIYDASGNVVLVYNGSGTLTDRMLNGPGANNALADENGSGTVSWFLKDRQGTTNDVIQYNSSTNTTTVVDHLVYGAFGNITSQTNSAYQPLFAYTGQMWDSAAGLYYYHARWFDPSTGRFISQDPIGFVAGDANLYRYVGNNAMNANDPTGKDATGTGVTDSAAMAQQNADMQKETEKAAEVEISADRPASEFMGDPQRGIELEMKLMHVKMLEQIEVLKEMSLKMQLLMKQADESGKFETQLMISMSSPLYTIGQLDKMMQNWRLGDLMQRIMRKQAQEMIDQEMEVRQNMTRMFLRMTQYWDYVMNKMNTA